MIAMILNIIINYSRRKKTSIMYQVHKCEMRISDNRWCTRGVCSIKSWLFCHLKKTVAESYRLLREPYGEHAPSQDTVNDGFGVLKMVTSTQGKKEHKIHGKLRKKF